MGIKRLWTNNKMYCNTALCKSSFVCCVVAIARYKGSVQYVGEKKNITRWPLSRYLMALGKPKKSSSLIGRGRGVNGPAINRRTFFLCGFLIHW